MLANIIVFDVGSTYTKAAAFHMKLEEESATFLGRGQSPTNIKPDSGRRGCGAGSDPESGSDY